MKRIAISLAAFAALYAVAAWAFVLPPFEPEPAYYENVPSFGQTYTCNGGVGPSIFVRFSDNGRIATVRERKRQVRLTYTGNSGLDEVYEAGPWRLTLDPEAGFTGPSTRYQNCY